MKIVAGWIHNGNVYALTEDGALWRRGKTEWSCVSPPLAWEIASLELKVGENDV